ncbi:MAG: hypothetical protein QXU67_01315 [Candidatus Bathyarchaeia archaeon]|nr:hypothetical protein [Candidatus Bathyarchaeota archaeon]
MPSRVVEVSLLIFIGTIAVVIGYTVILPLMSTTFETVDVKALESNYEQLMAILDGEGSIKTVHNMGFKKEGMSCNIEFRLENGKQLQIFSKSLMTVNSNVSDYGGAPWTNLVGDNRTYALSNRSSFVISGFKHDDKYTYLLYPRASIEISEEKISSEVSVFRILVTLNSYVLRSSTSTLEDALVGKDAKVSVEATEESKYPPLVWGSGEKLIIKVRLGCPFFKEERCDETVVGNQGKTNIYEVQIRIITKNVVVGS